MAEERHAPLANRINERNKRTVALSCLNADGQNPAPPRMMIIPLFIGF